MKTIQEIAEETRDLLRNLKNGSVKIPKSECPTTLWNLRGYLACTDEWNCLDIILANISGESRRIDDIDEYFEPTTEDDSSELWEWFILDQSHVRLVEEVIREYDCVNPAKNHNLYDSIARALLKKECEIFWAVKAHIMEVYKDQPDDDKDEDGEE